MLFLPVLACFSLLLPASFSTPILDAKPKPVDLKYSCMAVNVGEHPDQRPDDVPIILLHGLGGKKESWHGVMEVLALKTKKQVCIVDLRNHGESPWNNDDYDAVAMTEDIKHFIDERKARKAIVLGHSLGGKIAVHLALNYPERVEKIIVEDMRPNGLSPEGIKETKFFYKMWKELENKIPQGVTENEAKKGFLKLFNELLQKMNLGSNFKLGDPSHIPIKCTDGKCRLAFNPILLEIAAKNIIEVFNESSGRYEGPALFIYGGASGFKVGDDESNIKKLFPNAKLVEIAGANHLLHNLKKFMTEVIEFINEN